MKTLMILSLLILTSCGPSFKAGDCIVDDDTESWETVTVVKILEVGKKKYRVIYVKPDVMNGLPYPFDNIHIDTIMHKVECPK